MGEPRKLILVVEDEPVLRASMVRALERVRGVEVVDAASVRDSLLLIKAHQPDVLVTDLDLPDGSGVEVIARAGHVPALVVTAYLGHFQDALRAVPHVRVREKPLPVAELRRLVAEMVGPVATADTIPFTAVDYLQLGCMGRHSIAIDIHREGIQAGRIVVHQGELWSASDRAGSGLEALRRLLFLARAEITVHGLDDASLGERTIEGPWQALLLEAARQQDEAAAPAPPPSAPARAHESFESIYDRAVDALLRRRLAEAYELFQAAADLRPDDGRVKANLQRLVQLGYGARS